MKLSKSEEKAIAAGAVAVVRDEEPDCEKGDRIVVLWSKAGRGATEEDKLKGRKTEVWEVPPEPLVVAIVRSRTRRLEDWIVRFDLEDYRQDDRYLAKQHGRAPVSYVRNPSQAIDELAVVPEEDQRRITVEAHAKFAQALEDDAAEDLLRQQEKALREEMKAAVRELPPLQAQYALAGIRRILDEAREGKLAA